MRLDELDVWVYDFEVFAHDWLVCAKRRGADDRFSVWSDGEELAGFVRAADEAVFAGFNSKHYDQYILKAAVSGCTPEEVKEVNDWIVSEGRMGFEHPYLQGVFVRFHNTDLMDDTQKGTSLKSIEGHLGMSIEESSVPFDIETPLTEEQKEEVERYCWHDVEATEALLELRIDYLDTKLHLAEKADLDPYRALGMTDPKLAAALFKAEPFESDDERDYEFPERLKPLPVPKDVKAFFERVRDGTVSDEELFSSELETEIGGCPTVFAWGGAHGAVPRFRMRAGKGRRILNFDVASLYPSLMIVYGYVSRAVPDPQIFIGVRDERVEAKHEGDKRSANSLKSPLNKSFGAMGNKYNPMYDPRNKLSVCITGQLAISALAKNYEDVEGLRIIQLNTDGIMIDIPEEAYEEVVRINEEWMTATSLELEEDDIEFVWQKDVNNYAMLKTDGEEKVKGGYLVRGISSVGAWRINNNMVVVADALKAWLLYGVPVRETIEACDDPFKFQIIAKASGKYSRVYQKVGGEHVDVQRCNRVFASSDSGLGRLYKVKKSDGSVARIESLPEHCLVSNAGMPDIGDVDMAVAKAKAAEEPDYRSMNVWQKLMTARRMFLDAGVEKSGVNEHLEFEYFELVDIVPPETRIFEKVGLLELPTYVSEAETTTTNPETGEIVKEKRERKIVAHVVNVDRPDEKIRFDLPWPKMKVTVNREGRDTGNDLQRLGIEESYLRRYVKMFVLDLTESDVVDKTLGSEKEQEESAQGSKVKVESAKKPAARKAAPRKAASKAKPASPGRSEAAKRIADPKGAATRLQINQLKKNIQTVKKACGDDPEAAALIARIGLETDNLSGTVTKEQCEAYIRELGEAKQRNEKGDANEVG